MPWDREFAARYTTNQGIDQRRPTKGKAVNGRRQEGGEGGRKGKGGEGGEKEEKRDDD